MYCIPTVYANAALIRVAASGKNPVTLDSVYRRSVRPWLDWPFLDSYYQLGLNGPQPRYVGA